jgi:hypothetical protein
MSPSFFSNTTASKAADLKAYNFVEKGFPRMYGVFEVALSGNLMMHLKQMLLVSMKWK